MTFQDWNSMEPELERMAAEEISGQRSDASGHFRQRLDGKTLPQFDLDRLDGPPPPPRDWIVPDFMPAREITLFTGPGGSGKSLLAQQLASCLATGKPFLGKEVRQRNVLYLTAEDVDDELHRRQRNIMARIGRATTKGRLFLSSVRGRGANELVTFDREGNMQKGETFSLLHDTLIATDADVLVLDNVAHLFAGNENDRGHVTRFVNALYGLVRTFDLSILLIGHPNKSGDAYSGSTAWLNAVRSQIDLSRPEDAEHDLDARVLRLGKANYARAGNELRFRWHDFAFTLDTELPRDVMAEIAEVGRMNADDEAFLACLAERNRQERPVSEHPSANYAPTQFAKMREAKGIGKQRLTDAMDRLFRTGRIERGFVCRDAGKRRDMFGLIDVQEAPQTPAPNAPQTLAPDRPKLSAPDAPNTHPIPKGIRGAGPDGPHAPLQDDGEWIGESPAETQARQRRAKP